MKRRGFLAGLITGGPIWRPQAAEVRGNASAQKPPNRMADIRDFGAVGNGRADDTASITAAIASERSLYFGPGTYCVSSITFPGGQSFSVYFDGAVLVGVASAPTDCIVRIKTEGSVFWNLHINGNFNRNYKCALWWYDASASSQYNNIFGCKITYSVRGLVYGELPGRSSTSFAQSENAIYGWRTRGVQNPFCSNHKAGVLFFSNPIFVSLDEEWPKAAKFNWNESRAFEGLDGVVVTTGGELQRSGSAQGYAADVGMSDRFIGTVLETSAPIRVQSGGAVFDNCRSLMTRDDQPLFYISPEAKGDLIISRSHLVRPANVGSDSAQPVVDARRADNSFEIQMTDTELYEWRWNLIGGDVRPVLGGVPRYRNVKLNITRTDPHYYVLDTNAANLFDSRAVDTLAYSTAGWYLTNEFGDGTTWAVVPDGPVGYVPSSIELNATGHAFLTNTDVSSAASIRATSFRVRPGGTYSIAGWLKYVSSSGAPNARLCARFFNAAGTAVGVTAVTDQAALKGSEWTWLFAPLVVPAPAAYMGVGVECQATKARFTDLRLYRADSAPHSK